MCRVRCLLIVVLGAMLVCAAARAEEASVLLEAGVYAEEVVGDLDKAIETYEQIIADAEAGRRYVAEAHYRLGKCHLAKGDEQKAREQFAQLAERYADQEPLAAAAGAELAKLQPVARWVTEADLPIPVRTRLSTRQFCDLDEGEFISKRRGWQPAFDVTLEQDEGGHLSVVSRPGSSVRLLQLQAKSPADAFNEVRENPHVLRAADSASLPLSQGAIIAVQTDGLSGIQVARGETQPSAALAIVEITRVGSEDAEILYRLLAKAEPPLAFGPVIERVVNDDGVGVDFFIDFDTGKLFSPQNLGGAASDDAIFAAIRKLGIDATGETAGPQGGLGGIDMVVVPWESRDWDTIDPAFFDQEEMLSRGEPGFPVFMSAKGTLPAMYLFKTREGGKGILQILELRDQPPRGVKIRYKMVTAAEGAGAPRSRVVLRDDDRSGTMLNLATGELETAPHGTKEGIMAELERRGGHYLFYDRRQLIFPPATDANVGLVRAKAGFVAYEIPDALPATLVVSTSAGERYEITVLSVDRERCQLECRPRAVAGSALPAPPFPERAGLGTDNAGRLAELRIRLAEAQAELRTREAEGEALPRLVAATEKSFALGRSNSDDVVRARLELTRARAGLESARQKVEILTAEVARLKAEPKEGPASSDAARLTDLRIRLAEARAELATKEAALAVLPKALERAEMMAQVGTADAASVDRTRLVLTRARAGLESARQKVEILTAEIARIQDAEVTTWWTCSMHPQIRSRHAGQCPICGMHLVQGGLRDVAFSIRPGEEAPRALEDARQRAEREEEKQAIRQAMSQVGLAIMMYRDDKDGAYPANLAELAKGGYLEKEDSPFERWPDLGWQYVIPETKQAAGVVLFHWPPVDGQVTLLYQDSAVQSVTVAEDGVLKDPRTRKVIATPRGDSASDNAQQ